MQKIITATLFCVSLVILALSVHRFNTNDEENEANSTLITLQTELASLQQNQLEAQRQQDQVLSEYRAELAQLQFGASSRKPADDESVQYQQLLQEARRQVAREKSQSTRQIRPTVSDSSTQRDMVAQSVRNNYGPLLKQLGVDEETVETILAELVDYQLRVAQALEKKLAGEISGAEFDEIRNGSGGFTQALQTHLSPEQWEQYRRQQQKSLFDDERKEVDNGIERFAANLDANIKANISQQMFNIRTVGLSDSNGNRSAKLQLQRLRDQITAIQSLEDQLAAQLSQNDMYLVVAYLNHERQRIQRNIALNEALQ